MLVAVPLLTACSGDQERPAAAAPGPTTPAAALSSPPPAAATASASAQASPAPATPAPPAFDGTVVEITYAGGAITTRDRQVRVPLGSRVRLVATSDVQEEIHVHGVDAYVDLPPGQTTTYDFTASVPGTFEVELHGSGDVLFDLSARPR